MRTPPTILEFIWALPASIIGWLFLGFLSLFRQIDDFEIRRGFVFCWDVKNDGWFYRNSLKSGKWGGFCIGNNIVIVDLYPLSKYARTYTHEYEHVRQNFKLGPLFYPLYILESLYIFICMPKQHSYYDNCFEKAARKAAGQKIEIPRSEWKDPNDRWAWW